MKPEDDTAKSTEHTSETTIHEEKTAKAPTHTVFESYKAPSEPDSHRSSSDRPHSGWKYAALVFFCFVASFLGAWAYIGSGLIDVTRNPSVEEKRTVVAQEGEVVADAVERVSPSVVSIITEGIDRSSYFIQPQSGAGTGVIISKDGYVMTNKHVIGTNTTDISIIMTDGTVHENVKVVGRDPINDLAFLKIEGGNNFTPAELGDSSALEVGTKVIAIGNALGEYQTTVTTGIISGTGRPLTAGSDSGSVEQLENLLQTDAAINPGNSGGPLMTLDGKVIGINTAIAVDAEGIGFAIPINDAKGLIKGVLEDGKVSRAYLGVRYVTITAAVQDEYDLSEKEGAYIPEDGRNNIVVGSPAAKAGLKAGDIITKVNDKNVTQKQPLASLMSSFAVAEEVTLTYVRDGKTQTTKVVLDVYPN